MVVDTVTLNMLGDAQKLQPVEVGVLSIVQVADLRTPTAAKCDGYATRSACQQSDDACVGPGACRSYDVTGSPLCPALSVIAENGFE